MRQPVNSPNITQGYWNYMPQWYAYSGGWHTGIDYGQPCGSPVYAVTNGTVVKVGSDAGFGNYVLIAHQNNKFLALYAHLSGFNCSAWQHVEEGQVICWIGSTGFSTGCHLHFETKRMGSGLYNGWFNPAEIFNQQGDNMALQDKNAYYINDPKINPKVFVGLSNMDEAKATIGGLSAGQYRIIYSNNFVDVNGKIYQHVTSPDAVKIISNNKAINPTIIDVLKYEESAKNDATTIANLTAKLKECEGKEAVSPEDMNFLTTLKNWIKGLFK